MPRSCPYFLFILTLVFAGSVAAGVHAAEAKRVALVIDDGPVPDRNARLLELLRVAGVRVTFSHVGKNAQANPALVRAVAAAGHEIINHSYSHPHLKPLADDVIMREVADTQAAIREAGGPEPRWFWAPFLERDKRVDAAVRRAGLEHFPYAKFHFIGSQDWEAQTTGEKFRALTTTGITDGTVILMHEWPDVTLANLAAVISTLKTQGTTFVTFSELVPPAGATTEKGLKP